MLTFLQVNVAQIPVAYYNSAQGLSGAPLKLALHNIIDNHTSVNYGSLWTHFQTTDVKPNGKVWDIYSDVPNGTPPYQFIFTTSQCGSYQLEGDCYNREHSWPQSWFNSITTPSSDMFHIYPTDGKVNGIRSNFPYGEVAVAGITTLNGSMLGTSATLDYTGTVFEPIDEYKGDLARGYFYMSTRYMGEDSSWSSASGQMTNKSEILPWGLALLLSWHHADTVSTKELNRNNAIYQIQHNRNPFIDNPQWADSIWSQVITNFKTNQSKTFRFGMMPNPANGDITIQIDTSQLLNAHLYIKNLCGQFVGDYTINNPIENISITNLCKGIYIVEMQNKLGTTSQKLVVK